MPALPQLPQLLTLEEYENYPENERIEVFDGIVYNMAGPSRIHQALLLELSSFLRSYVKEKKGGCEVIPAPFDVQLSDNPLTIVQPDILIVCDQNKLTENRCNGAPDFIIEIVSPSNASDDYIRKLYYYKNAGVREYWIVDPRRKLVIVNYFENNLFNLQYSFDATIKVHIYEDLYIDFSEISKSLNL